MQLPFWSDEDRLFVIWPLGVTLNAKWLARRLGFLKERAGPRAARAEDSSSPAERTAEECLRERIEASKYEEQK